MQIMYFTPKLHNNNCCQSNYLNLFLIVDEKKNTNIKQHDDDVEKKNGNCVFVS